MRFTRVAGLCLLFALLLSTPANAQQNYRSVAGIVNWGSASSWEVQIGNNWFPSSFYPGQNSSPSQVIIRDFSVVTIDVNILPIYTIGELVVGEGTGGVLQFDNANRTLNIGSGGVTVNAGATFQFGNGVQTLTVNNGGSVTVNGTFQFGNGVQTLTVNNGGSVQVNAGGTFQVTSAAPNTTHTINITGGGSFTNDGTVNFRISSGGITDVANLNLSGNLAGTGTSTFNNIIFNGTTNQTITIGGTINNIQAVTYNNTGTAPNNQITNQSTTFTAAINPGTSTFTQGNYRHDNTGIYNVSTGR